MVNSGLKGLRADPWGHNAHNCILYKRCSQNDKFLRFAMGGALPSRECLTVFTDTFEGVA